MTKTTKSGVFDIFPLVLFCAVISLSGCQGEVTGAGHPIPPHPPGFDDACEENDSIFSAWDFSEGKNQWLSDYANNGYALMQSDDDYYKIHVAAENQRVVVTCVFNDALGDIDIDLYDSNWQNIASSHGMSDNETIDMAVSSAGDYYILVNGWDDGNTYDLKWDANDINPPGPDDPYEPNDTMYNAYDLDASGDFSLDGYIYPQGDDDYFKIYREAGSTVDITLTNLPQDFDLYLLDEWGNVRAQSIKSGTNSERIVYTLPFAGEFYIQVFGASNVYSGTTPYHLSVTFY